MANVETHAPAPFLEPAGVPPQHLAPLRFFDHYLECGEHPRGVGRWQRGGEHKRPAVMFQVVDHALRGSNKPRKAGGKNTPPAMAPEANRIATANGPRLSHCEGLPFHNEFSSVIAGIMPCSGDTPQAENDGTNTHRSRSALPTCEDHETGIRLPGIKNSRSCDGKADDRAATLKMPGGRITEAPAGEAAGASDCWRSSAGNSESRGF